MNRASLLESLRSAGLDVDSGLERLNGDLALFLQILRRFVQDDAQGMSQLEDCLGAGRREEARILAHTLRGTTAVIGALGLSDSFRLLECDILRIAEDGALPDREIIRKTETLFTGLTARLRDLDLSLPSETGKTKSFSLSDEEWTEKLGDLREYVDLQQPRDCRELLDLLISSGPDERVGKALRELDAFVRGYRFDEALERIEGLMEERRAL